MAFVTFSCAFVTALLGVDANEFLKAAPKLAANDDLLSEDDIRASLLAEVEESLGAGSASSRLNLFMKVLKPIFTALPKNAYGNLDHNAVRHALHRVFILRHGWSIKGLDSDSGYNSSSPAGVLKDQVQAYIQGMFEKRLEGKGLGLNELSVLASTIEHLIHNEAVSRLGAVFNVYDLMPFDTVSESMVDELIDTYMMAYILGQNLKNLTSTEARRLNQQMPELFLAWKDTQQFVRKIRRDVERSIPAFGGWDFGTVAKVAEKVGEDFGSFQDFECKQLKSNLMKRENRAQGRLTLAEFYKPARDGSWQFQESVGYLRQLGALDESSRKATLLIPNYLYSAANCIASSGFYSVCCKNECEGLFGHLEEKLASPYVQPSDIIKQMSELPSPSSPLSLPPQLSELLVSRLDEIAVHHGGRVALHGRLFAQWMHHAYPRECPYPHLSGTTSQQTPDEWMNESGIESVANQEEMLQFVDGGAQKSDTSSPEDLEHFEDAMVWSSEEELLVCSSEQLPKRRMSPALRGFVLMTCASLLVFGLIQSSKRYRMGSRERKFVV